MVIIPILMLFVPFLILIVWFVWIPLSQRYDKYSEKRMFEYREKRMFERRRYTQKANDCRKRYSEPQSDVRSIIESARKRSRQ